MGKFSHPLSTRGTVYLFPLGGLGLDGPQSQLQRYFSGTLKSASIPATRRCLLTYQENDGPYTNKTVVLYHLHRRLLNSCLHLSKQLLSSFRYAGTQSHTCNCMISCFLSNDKHSIPYDVFSMTSLGHHTVRHELGSFNI